MDTPILFLVFNRPSLTQKVFDEIKKVKPKKLYIAIDGPRIGNANDQSNINDVLKIFNDVPWQCEFKFLKREFNLGCGVSISNALNWFFTHEEEGIILEDDCVPSQDFFFFCESMLEKYRTNDSIMAINGSNPLGEVHLDSSYFFSKYNFVWGWATWRKSWNLYEFDLNKESNFKRRLFLIKSFRYDFISIRNWFKHLNLVKIGKIDTWDYQWMYTCWKYNGLIITPSVNLICNIGNEVEPTHGFINSNYIGLKYNNITFPLIHPTKVQLNRKIDRKIKATRFGTTFFLFLKSKYNKLILKWD
jgi:hypothetical protein